MRPLPPYTARPLKRPEIRRPAAALAVRPSSMTAAASVRPARTPLKAAVSRERPRLKVLEQAPT